MLSRFKGQDRVEKRFSTIKGPIRIRPVFLHNENRIEALVLMCMVALLVFSLLELLVKRVGVEVTGRKLIEQFQGLHAIYTGFADGSYIRLLAPLTPFQDKLLTSLQFPFPHVYLDSRLSH